MDILKKIASQWKNPVAQYMVAVMYDEGDNGAQTNAVTKTDFPNPGDRDVYRGIQEINRGNYQEAQKCFEKGSNYDNEYASLFNALHYYTGFGFAKRDPSKALNLFKKISLEWNNPIAQYLIGAMYLHGDQGITSHEKYASKWLSLAAENNWTAAMLLLSGGYQDGKFLKKDDQKALSWLQRIAQKDDNETDPIDDGVIYLFDNKEFELQLTPEILSAHKLTVDSVIVSLREFLYPPVRSAAPELNNEEDAVIWSLFTNRKSHGVFTSQRCLGLIYSGGTADTLPDGQKANYFFKKAAKNGSIDACLSLGIRYKIGINGIQNYRESLRWYKHAFELYEGIIESAYPNGRNYYNAKCIENDGKLTPHYLKFMEFFSELDNDIMMANLLMGQIYEHGKDGVSQDYILAHRYYEKAYNCGDVRGAIALVKFYMEGLGVRKDNEKADEWKLKAVLAKNGLVQTGPCTYRLI
ncbi:hypothetical protein MFLAVUS_009073 [Mucor flavus]|uniref:Sel1 repeat family protein n=1 Tax=Mucor flavus TaxID=439312 RepID=A0ABP9Z8V7_9FUNG